MAADRQVISSQHRRLWVFGGPVLETRPLATHGERTVHPAGCGLEGDVGLYQADDQFTARKARWPGRAVARVFRAADKDIVIRLK